MTNNESAKPLLSPEFILLIWEEVPESVCFYAIPTSFVSRP